MSENRVDDSSSIESLPPSDNRINKPSIATRLGEMIRVNLPIFGNHLKRLMGFKTQSIENAEIGSDANETMSILTSTVSYGSSNETFTIEDSSSSVSGPFAVSIRPGNLTGFFVQQYPSSSDYSSPLMISSGVNTATNAIRRLTIADVVNDDGVIITQNPGELAAAIGAQMGNQTNDGFETLFESRRVPLYVPLHDLPDYTMSSTTIDSSSSYGTATSEEDTDETSELEILRRRREFYDHVTHGHSVRKQFQNFDDEPPIY